MYADQCLLDMDGVLMDFNAGVEKAHGRKIPFDKPGNQGIWNIESLWGMDQEEFWAPIGSVKFWEELPKTPEADELVDYVMHKFEGNVAIATAPAYKGPGDCYEGKLRSVRKHFPALKRRVIVGSAKEFMASERRVLIDDKDANVKSFCDAGGCGILMPRLWNSLHLRADRSLDEIKRILEENYFVD